MPQYAPPAAVAAPAPQASFAAPAFSAPSHVGAEVEVMDGSKAIEVQSIYRGIVINTRHLTDASGKSTAGQSKAFIAAGIAFVLIALITFFITIINAGREKTRYEAYLSEGNEAKNFQWAQSPAMDFVVFGGIGSGIALSTWA